MFRHFNINIIRRVLLLIMISICSISGSILLLMIYGLVSLFLLLLFSFLVVSVLF